MIVLLRSRIRSDEKGMTLVEVSLTMLILAILLIMAFDFLDRTTKITVSTDTHARAEDNTQRVLRTVTQHIRGAFPIEGTCTTSGYSTSYSNCVRFSVPRNESGFGGCTRTEFVIGLVDAPDPAPVDEKLLAYDRVEHAGTSCGAGALTGKRLLLDRVVNDPTTEPLFTYYTAAGNPTTAAASIPSAATVVVNLRVRHRTGSNPIVLSSSAALRNNITR